MMTVSLQMMDQLQGALLDTNQLQALLDPTEASNCRFLYNIMMLEVRRDSG